MSKITQIEPELQSLDLAGFQRLCDLYLGDTNAPVGQSES